MLKKIIITTLFLPVLLLAIVFALLSQIDPNEYKEELAAMAHQQTGGLLQIAGDIEMGLFPSLEFQLGETRFTPRGEEKPLLSLEGIKLGVALMPILNGRIEIASIEIDGMDIYAAINEQGVGNWESLLVDEAGVDAEDAAAEDSDPLDDEPVSPNDNQSDATPIHLNIDTFAIRNAGIVYDDKQAGSMFSLKPFSLSGNGINTQGEAFDFTVALNAKLDDVIAVEGEYSTQATVNLSPLKIQLNKNRLSLLLSGKDLPLEQHKITSNFDLIMTDEKLWLEPFSVTLDKTTFTGKLGIKDMASQHIEVNLAGDSFNTDTYFSSETSADETENVEPQTDQAAQTTEPTTGDEELLPVEQLKTLLFDVAITLDEFIASGIKVQGIKLNASGKDGKLALHNFSGQLYQGLLDVSVEVDVNPQPPQFVINKKIDNVQLQPLLIDAGGIKQVEGVANFTMQLTTEGNSINALKKNLDGPLDFEIYKSRINDLNLEKMVCQGVALVNKESLSDNWSNHTEFTQMKGRVEFKNGEGELKLQPAQLQNLKLNAEGDILLPQDAYDVLLTLELNGDLSKRDKACRVHENIDGAEWPIRCEGKFSDEPGKACGLDKKGLAKILKRAARNAAVDKLKSKIKGFFGG